jgi:hypothetical protein
MCDYSNFSWQKIDDANGLQWGGESLYRDGIFPIHDGRANLYTVPCEPFVEQLLPLLQKITLAPNWTCRELVAVESSNPAVPGDS